MNKRLPEESSGKDIFWHIPNVRLYRDLKTERD
jgi:hypothetical protein